jgi:hypothetical protein
MIATSTDGLNFNPPSVFQDSSGVATVLNLGGDTLISAFQWFPSPMNSTYWDKIAVKFSYDGGATWTSPISCNFTGLPGGFQRPFDPALVELSNGQLRMYFSTGPTGPTAGAIDTYSATSTDGINYTVESNARVNHATYNCIDPTVALFNSVWYYNAWTSNQTDGHHRATSTDGLNFTVGAMNAYDGSHLWLGNYYVDGSTLRFYGCGSGMWTTSSTDGVTWSSYQNISLMGADPAVTKNDAGTYIMIYTGPPNLSSIADASQNLSVRVYPNPANGKFTVRCTQTGSTFRMYNTQGEVVMVRNLTSTCTDIYTQGILRGVYYYEVQTAEGELQKGKLVITN